MPSTRVRIGTLSAALVLVFAPVTAAAETRIEKSFAFAPGGSFTLDSDLGSVRVEGSDQSGARVLVTSNRDELEKDFDLKFEESTGQLRVVLKRKSSSRWTHDLSVSFDVKVPASTRLEVITGGGSIDVSGLTAPAKVSTSGGSIHALDQKGDIAAETSGGSIELRRARGVAKLHTSGGGITVEALEGPLEAGTSGGSIELDGVTGDLVARTSGGSIRIREAAGRVDARTSAGSIDAAFAKGNARGGTLVTSAGQVRVRLDRSVDLEVDAATSAGSVTTEIPLTVVGSLPGSSVKGKLNKGGEILKLRTSAGSITIE
jgi:DUF4097 and DUF4098 domain-containing protein YvlB